jgi:putative ABC transport system permease protein
MNRLPALAVRNVGRNRRRSLITGVAIFVCVVMVMLLRGFIDGTQALMEGDIVEGRSGALQIHKKGYVDNIEAVPTRLNIPYSDELLQKIRAVPNVKGVSGRITFNGLVGNGLTQTMFIGRALDVEHEEEACPRARTIVKPGGQPLRKDDKTAALVGYELGESFGIATEAPPPEVNALLKRQLARENLSAVELQPLEAWVLQQRKSLEGKTVTVQTTSPGGRSNAMDLKVRGFSTSSFPFENKRVITVPLATAQDLLSLQGRVTEYAVSVHELQKLEETKAALQAALGPEYEVHTWQELNTFVRDVINRQNIMMGAIALVLFIIALTVIGNTMLMSVFERVREIGTLLAVGVRRRQVLQLFMLEAAVLGIIGGIAGALVGRLALFIISSMGIALEMPGTSGLELLEPWVSVRFVIFAVIVATLGAVLASALPARRAARLNPVDALRNA